MNVSETNTFISNVTGETYKINQKLNCDDTAWFIFCPVSVVEKHMFGKQPTTLDIDGITIRIVIESILVRRAVCKNIFLNILTAWDTVVSLTMF